MVLQFCCVGNEVAAASAAEAAWIFCAPLVNYANLRKNAAAAFASKVNEVQGLVARFQKTQRAAEKTLNKCALLRPDVAAYAFVHFDSYEKSCAP
jgi:hypothetical protein